MEIASHIAESVSSGLPHSDVRISHSVVPDLPEEDEGAEVLEAEDQEVHGGFAAAEDGVQEELAAVGTHKRGGLAG